MVPVLSLWLSIALAAAFVFIASSIIHMMLPYHKSDYKKLPAEDEVMAALRKFTIPPGDYVVPCAGDYNTAMKDPAFIEKMTRGPVGFFTIMKTGVPAMGAQLVQWFVYCLVVSLFAAYIAGRALGPEAHYLAVFRFAGCTAFLGYALALWQNTIWYKRSWIVTMKSTVDGLVYGLITAGTFGWLWPE